MNIIKYKAIKAIEVNNKLFLINDILYATPSFRVMNGKYDYARKVFDGDKNYLGFIRDSNFPIKNLESIK